MIAALLIAVVLIQGYEGKAVGDNCGDDRFTQCYKLYPEELRNISSFPTEEVLDRTCPYMLETGKCLEDFVKECKDQKDEIFGVYTFNVNFVRLMCDKKSLIRYYYLMNSECYESVNSRFHECRDKGSEAYERYIESTGYEDKTEFKYHQSCLQSAYGMACSVSEIEASCGRIAYRVFFEMEKLKDSVVFTKYFCSHIDFDKEIKSGFFTTLRIPESRRQVFDQVIQELRN
ncbi:uncharacterized protein TNIN_447981 [Trichonephila inaurata madagascariensis]|uniref:Uncharacterized protein n=1 Tax=Trichonephila inaurata madagascariensis TaxID=2747483 RepID=A0A8X6WP42_9ARAC|nr:uncharacterized protein TNIN_447981 [Trichonephila inaurata madagascariensis]